jgi:DNA-binding NarL/FixJ family response regulator
MKPVKHLFAEKSPPGSAAHPPKTDPRYWKSRLIRRRYTDAVKLISGPEYSTRIEHDNISFFFPLGSDDEDRAAATAVQIHSLLLNRGWKAVCGRFPREITVAVFWCWNPMACTYTTLYSKPAQFGREPDSGRPPPEGSCRVGIIESEAEIRRALAFWIDRQPGFVCGQTFSTVKEAVNLLRTESADLVLIRRDLLEQPAGERIETFKQRVARTPVFSFGVYEESNYIFHSVTGVPAGYFMRRVPPDQLFDPIRKLAAEPRLPARLLVRQIEKYFQSLFALPDQADKEQELAHLTDREHEILVCLSKGLADKQIADALKISVWTVHGHVKNVFEKLGVHSRTEAVIKFLQK